MLLIPKEKVDQRGQAKQVFFCTIDGLENASRLYGTLKSLLVIGY